MNWHTFELGASAVEKNEARGIYHKVYHSHAVDTDTDVPLCGRVKLESLCYDTSLNAKGALPTCPACLKKLAKLINETPTRVPRRG